jgi:hypothetical protein
MSLVYLKSQDDEILALDSVTEVSESQQNSVTKSSVMSGAEASDGYTIGNITVAFSGICTYSKIPRSTASVTAPNPKELNALLKKMVNSQTRFTLYGNDLIPTLNEVVITGFSVTQSRYSNAVEVSVALEQVFVTDAAQATRITKPTKEAEEELPEKPKFRQRVVSAATIKGAEEQIRVWSLTTRGVDVASNFGG